MRFTQSLGLLFGLAASVLASPIPSGERTASRSWGTYAEYPGDVVAKRQFDYYGYGLGDDGHLAKRQFRYNYRGDDDDGDDYLAKRQFDYGYAEESESNMKDILKRPVN